VSPLARGQSEFQPASFGDHEKSLGRLSEVPELRGDTLVTILCIGILEDNGKFDGHGCFQRDPGDGTFISRIYDAAKKARLTPATYGGREVDVVFQYQVQFRQKDEERTLGLLPNPGVEENVEAYGPEHSAAQRLLHRGSWEKDCPQQTAYRVLVKANVDLDGTPSAVSVNHVSGIPITARCEQALERTILDSRFIPAFDDGEAVPSTYAELFGNH